MSVMEKAKLEKYQPSCMLAHDFINKLSVIIGRCELLNEMVEENSECSKRLLMVRDIANSMVEELRQRQCHLDVMTRAGMIEQQSKHNPRDVAVAPSDS